MEIDYTAALVKLPARFVSKVNFKGPIPEERPELGQCWEWTAGAFADGYGGFSVLSKNVRVHRFAWEILRGPIPDNLEPDHLCRNRLCINPNHIEIVTHQVNNLRGRTLTALHAQATHCPQGHPYDLFNTYYAKNGGRCCRACHREYMREYMRAKKERSLCGT